MCYKYFMSIHFSLKYNVYIPLEFTSGLVRLDACAIALEECQLVKCFVLYYIFAMVLTPENLKRSVSYDF